MTDHQNHLRPLHKNRITSTSITWSITVGMSRTPLSTFAAISARENWLLDLFRPRPTMREMTQAHAQIIKTGFQQNVFVIGRLISSCALSDEDPMDYAAMIFDRIECPDGFLWNTMIRGYGKAGKADAALNCYRKMQTSGGEGDSFTFSFLLKACSQPTEVVTGKQVHCCTVKSGLDQHVHVRNTLIHMYGMFEDLGAARFLFAEMPTRSSVSWNTIIDVHAHCGVHKEALRLFLRMQKSGFEPDDATMVVVLSACSELGAFEFGRWTHHYIRGVGLDGVVSVSNTLIDMYSKCGAIDRAAEVFDGMGEEKNVVTWNSMISGLAVNGHAGEALKLFSRMRQWDGGEPNDVTFVGVLTACSHGGLVKEGKRYFDAMQKVYGISPRISHYGCMVDLLGRAGLLSEAYELIENMTVECNAVVWRTLLAACRVHGDMELGELVRNRLMGLEPDHSGDYVLLSSLYACSSRWKDAVRQREIMRERGVHKPKPGNSLITSTRKCNTKLKTMHIS